MDAARRALRRAGFPADDRTRPQSDLQISVNLDQSFGRIEDEDRD